MFTTNIAPTSDGLVEVTQVNYKRRTIAYFFQRKRPMQM